MNEDSVGSEFFGQIKIRDASSGVPSQGETSLGASSYASCDSTEILSPDERDILKDCQKTSHLDDRFFTVDTKESVTKNKIIAKCNNCSVAYEWLNVSSNFLRHLKQPGKLDLEKYQEVRDVLHRYVTNSCCTHREKEISKSDCKMNSLSESKVTDANYKMNLKRENDKRRRKKCAPNPPQLQNEPPIGTVLSPSEIAMHQQEMKPVEKAKDVPTNTDAEEKESSVDLFSTSANDSCMVSGTVSFLKSRFRKLSRTGEKDKLLDGKINLTSFKEEEKLEKSRLKEETAKLRKQQDKEKEQGKKIKRINRKMSSSLTSCPIESHKTHLASLPMSIKYDKNNIPIFLHTCIQFLEEEGLKSEGLYRVPGNRVNVDLLFQKFEEDSNVDIKSLDIPVNAVATALKDFFSKRLPPLLDKEIMAKLEQVAGSGLQNTPSVELSMKAKTDQSSRLIKVRNQLKKLPDDKYAILKLIFQHFVRVNGNSKLNSMNSRNLAICWWPTLIPIDFTDIGHFEQLRPHLEDIVQTMIDEFPYCFCDN